MKLAKSAALMCAAALSLVAPAAAHATGHEDTHLDLLGDAAYFKFEGGPGDGVPTVDSRRTVGDIRGIHAVHGTAVVHVAIYYRSLPSAGIKNVHEFRFKTPETYRLLSIVAKDGNWRGSASLTTFSGNRTSCPGLEYVIEYSHKRVVVDIPRSCLSRLEFVRVGAQGLFYQSDRVWVDDAYFAGEGYAGPGYGPALHR